VNYDCDGAERSPDKYKESIERDRAEQFPTAITSSIVDCKIILPNKN